MVGARLCFGVLLVDEEDGGSENSELRHSSVWRSSMDWGVEVVE